MQCLGAICTGKGAGSWEPGAEAYYASDLEPAVLDTERTWSTAQELKRQLSTLPGGQAARGVAWGGAGPGGLSSLESRASNGQGLAPAAFVPTRLQSIPAEQQRGFLWSKSRMDLEVAIAVEQQAGAAAAGGAGEDAGPFGREADILAGEQLLRERLGRLSLDMLVVEGDGSCQFRAISHGLYGTQRHHGIVRRKAVEHMLQYRRQYEGYLGEEFGHYTEAMARSGTWGDELTLRAVCEMYGVVINVCTTDAEHWFLRYIPRHTTIRSECFLTYIAPVHYNCIQRRSAGLALRSRLAGGRQQSRILAALRGYQARQALPQSPGQLASAPSLPGQREPGGSLI